MEEPGRLQSMGSLRVGHDWATSLWHFTFMHWRRKWQPLQCSCLENPRDRGAWWAAVYGVAQSWTGLKQLSSSSPERRVIYRKGRSQRSLQKCGKAWKGFQDGTHSCPWVQNGESEHTRDLPKVTVWTVGRIKQSQNSSFPVIHETTGHSLW